MYCPQKSKFITFVSLFTILAGVLVICGWLLNIDALKTLIPQYVTVKFSTAMCLCFLGLTTLLTQQSPKKNIRFALITLSIIVALFGLFGLLQDLLQFHVVADQFFNGGNDTLTITNYSYNSYATINTSICTLLLGLAFLLLGYKQHKIQLMGQYMLHVVTLISTVAIIGYLYGLSLFYKFSYVSSMPVHTASLFFGISIAAALLHPQYGLTNLFTGSRVGNQMARKLFLPLELIFVVLGFLRFKTQYNHLVTLEVSIYMLPLIMLVICLTIVALTAIWLNRIDEKRSAAENEVISINSSLEKRVAERSVELTALVDKLGESERRYRLLIEHASDAIYVLNFDNNFTEVNASMCKMTGYSREELLQLNLVNLIEPGHLKIDPIVLSPDELAEAVIKERRFLKKDGTSFDVEVNVKKFSDDRILVIARDITARKAMETELRLAELKFRTLAEKSMVGIYIVQKRKFTYVNPRFAQVFGYSQEELINAPSAAMVVSEQHRDIALEHIRARLAGEIDSIDYEAIGQRADGSLNWVEFYGNMVTIDGEPTIIGSMIDITERKEAEELLRQSELKYKLLFDSNPLPMWMISKDDLSIIAANKAATRHYGYTIDEFLQMNARDLRIEEDWSAMVDSFNKNTSDSGDQGIFKHQRKDGSIINVQIITQDIVFNGRPVRLSLANDITEKIKSEELLRKSEANLQTILNTTDSAYALFDKNLRVLAYNTMAAKFIKTQYKHEQDGADLPADYFPIERFPQLEKFAGQVLTGHHVSYEIDYQQPNGDTMWYDVRLLPIIDSNDLILGLMISLYDITERKNAESDLKAAYERIHAQINSIKTMAWKQSHFMRSPVANLKGLAAMLKDDPGDATALAYVMLELDRLDAVIIEMANDAAIHED
jgi:PAS domain S-box-containing protein